MLIDAAQESGADGDAVDFEVTQETPTIAASAEDPTAEMPTSEPTVESPTIEEQFAGLDSTSELPSISDAVEEAIAESGQSSDATAEINLDELGLDLDSLDVTEVASFDNELDITSSQELLEDTGINEVLPDDLTEATGKNPEVDPDATLESWVRLSLRRLAR